MDESKQNVDAVTANERFKLADESESVGSVFFLQTDVKYINRFAFSENDKCIS